MRELTLRILRHAIPVAIILGVMGYGFAEALLVLWAMGGAPRDPANDSVRWCAPLTFAGSGVALLVVLELVFHFMRRKKTIESKTVADAAPAPPDKKSSSTPIDS